MEVLGGRRTRVVGRTIYVIFRTVKLPNEWRTSTVIPFIGTKVIFKIVIITKALNCLAIV